MPLPSNGLVKLMEECGELVQIAAKKSTFMDTDDHPDGAGSMQVRLEDEIADVMAACELVIENFKLHRDTIEMRRVRKVKLLKFWHDHE